MVYDEIFCFENLYQAHLKARRGKRFKKDVISFELNLSQNLWNCFDALKERRYCVGKYNKFNVYEPKKREIQSLPYVDRVVQHALCDYFLYPLITSKLIYDNCACQKGKGMDFAIDRLTAFFSKYYKKYGDSGYILKADIRKYFPSVDHNVLKNILNPIVSDKELYDLLCEIIDSYNGDAEKGLPMGNQTSQLFALLYLNEIDRLCKEQLRIKYYVRYMDDIIILCNDKNYLYSCLEIMKKTAKEKLKLEFNEKTQIYQMKNGVDFLGFHFYLSKTGKVIKKLRNSSKKKYKHRMRKFKRDYAKGSVSTEEIKKTFPGYNGHLARGHTYRLRKAVLKDFVLIKNFEVEKNE